ncbi:hypothetical protein APSETT444_006808 [Aspergillus pseudonomiae]
MLLSHDLAIIHEPDSREIRRLLGLRGSIVDRFVGEGLVGVPVCLEGFQGVPFRETRCLRRVLGVGVAVEGEVEEVGAPDEDAVGPDEVASSREGVVVVLRGDGQPHGPLVQECAPDLLSQRDQAGCVAQRDRRRRVDVGVVRFGVGAD